MDISKYKCAIVEYTCDDCMIGNNFVIKFDFNKRTNFVSVKGHCSHIDLLFFQHFNNFCLFNFFVELECKSCGKKDSKNLINKDSNDEMANLHYKCQCGDGNLNIGILFQENIFDNSNNKENSDIEQMEEKINIGNNEKKIKNNDLYLSANNSNYKNRIENNNNRFIQKNDIIINNINNEHLTNNLNMLILQNSNGQNNNSNKDNSINNNMKGDPKYFSAENNVDNKNLDNINNNQFPEKYYNNPFNNNLMLQNNMANNSNNIFKNNQFFLKIIIS